MVNKGPLFIVPWRCPFACDNNCAHCASAGKPPAPDEVNTTDAKHIIDQIYDFGATYLGINGGEALLRKDFFQLANYAKQIGLKVSIITDAHRMDTTAFDELVKLEASVSISIDGAETINDAIRGKGTYAKSVDAIKKFSQQKLLNCLVYTFANLNNAATNVNTEDFTHVINLAQQYNAKWTVFHGFIPYSSAEATLKANPTPAQYEWAWNKLYDLRLEYKGKPDINVYDPFFARIAKQRGMPNFTDWYENFFLGRCWFGKFLALAENGDAIPCSFNDVHRFGNIKNKPLKAIWDDMQNSEFFQKARDKNNLKGKCGVCEYKEICGGCRTSAYYFTGDILESDPRCGYIPKALRQK